MRKASRTLMLAAVGETVMGVAMLAHPSVVGLLLLGQQLDGAAIPAARIAGAALIGLGVACWPGRALHGMFAYSAIVAVYLLLLGLGPGPTGRLLWPAVALHLFLTALLARDLRDTRTSE